MFYMGAPRRQRWSVERYSVVMSGRRSQIKGSLPWREVRGCGHVSGLLVRDGAPLALMVSARSFP